MPGTGLQEIPLRVPKEWDAAWFTRFVREVLALADIRNAREGLGVSIEGNSSEPATIAVGGDIAGLLDVPFVTLQTSSLLTAERVITAGDGIELDDAGAGSSLTISVTDIPYSSLQPLPPLSVLGNQLPTTETPAAIGGIQAGDVLWIADVDGAGTLNVQFTNTPIWTGNHTWNDNVEVRLGTGGDLRLFHDGTDSTIRNDTGVLKFLDSATQRMEIDTKVFAGLTAAQEAGVTGLADANASLVANLDFNIHGAAAPNFIMTRFNGSYASPTAVASGEVLFRLDGRGYRTSGGNGVNTGFSLRAESRENFTSSAGGTQMTLRLAPVGSTTATLCGTFTDEQMLYSSGTVSLPGYSFIGDPDSGRYRIGANNFADVCAGASVLEYGAAFVTIKAQSRLDGEISPTQLTANTNNWNPTGLSSASVIRFSTDASRDITGIAGGASGRELYLFNIGSFPAVFKNDVTSTAANRFLLASGTDTTVQAGGCIHLWYDNTSQRWRQINRVA